MGNRGAKIKAAGLIALSLLVLAALFAMDETAYGRHEKKTLGMSVEELDVTPGIRMFVPEDENAGLPCDLYATLFNEDESIQYLVVPDDLDASKLVCYAESAAGDFCNRFVLDFSDTDTCTVGLRQVILKRTHLPILSVSIDPYSPTLEELCASNKDVECYGSAKLSVTKEAAHANGWIEEIESRDGLKETPGSVTLRGRGNTSWDFAKKKSYTLVFDKAVYMLDLGKNKKWNLVANAFDQTLLRNEVLLEMAGDMGVPYEPKCEQVSLFIDGHYQGAYLLTTKVNVDKDRVALKKGDFLLNWGGTDEEQPIYYTCPAWEGKNDDYRADFMELEWPKNDSEEDLKEKQVLVQELVDAITDPSDPHLWDILDLESTARYYWAQEISMNFDADFRSTYLYYKADSGKFYFGPVWDLDLALGWNADKFGGAYMTPEGFPVRMASWYADLFKRPEFKACCEDLYRTGGIREAMYDAIDRFEARISEMAEDGDLDHRTWQGNDPVLGIKYGDTYEAQAQGTLQFFKDRAAWIDRELE
ncbi:MAG: CotH kinase family protein [Lachnospiraceae bacterium]|nr:CotH kinase family protein [Lachnospiraceae bacterium]